MDYPHSISPRAHHDAGEPGPVTAESGVISRDMRTLAALLVRAGHLQEGALALTDMLTLDEGDLVRRGLLRRVMGPGRWDSDWLIPSGELLELCHDLAAVHVLAAWENYRERKTT